MKSKEEQIIFVGRQAEFERHLARLYSLYQLKFPDFKLWGFLVEEERKHEDWLKQIIPKIKTGEIYFFIENLTIQAIDQMIEYINEEYGRSDKEGITLIRAVSVAHSIEDSALDKNFFNYFDSENPAVEEVLDNLKNDTTKHRDLLYKAKTNLKDFIDQYR
jgi:rubrerythrin